MCVSERAVGRAHLHSALHGYKDVLHSIIGMFLCVKQIVYVLIKMLYWMLAVKWKLCFVVQWCILMVLVAVLLLVSSAVR